MPLYLGDNLIAGTTEPQVPTRNIGTIIQSTIPLSDAGLHLLDGSRLDGSGIYSAFVEYMADLYDGMQPIEVAWVQPVLTSNGTMGGNSFACTDDKHYSDRSAYCLFDNNSSTGWNTYECASPTVGTVTIYNPDPLKITSIQMII